jgi:hypothetical protein
MINSSSELSICFSHLDEAAAMVRQAVREAGGLPFEIKTTVPSDFITGAGRGGRYLKASRDLLVNDIEVAVEGAVFDGMVCLSSCDKTAPAHMMAAALPEYSRHSRDWRLTGMRPAQWRKGRSRGRVQSVGEGAPGARSQGIGFAKIHFLKPEPADF